MTGAVLVIAKLDRLSRNAAFLLALRDSGVRFVAAGEPWLAILNLHKDTTKVRSVPCESEMEAIQAVECWLEGLLA